MKNLNLLPKPKQTEYGGGAADASCGFCICSGDFADAVQAAKALMPNIELGARGGLKVTIVSSANSEKEEYVLGITKSEVKIECSSSAGAFYALVTLGQIFAACENGKLPCVRICDKPDFANRGIMVDVSRNRIPHLRTLKQTVDFAALLKINQFQLYFDGKPFLYPSLAEHYDAGADVLTSEELCELDAYCKSRFVEFVPNQNCFGHMTEWLDCDAFRHLAECPDGFDYFGTWMPPSTLNPQLEESFEFVAKQFGDLLPLFSSNKVNIGGDEPFELGEGASREICARLGRGIVYLDFMRRVFDLVAKYGKSPMMWGDVFKTHYNECKEAVPHGVTVLEWGYNSDSYTDEVCELYEKAGVKYYLCPGTSLWNTVTGKTDNMLANVKSAARLGAKHGADGILTVNWGDGGTCQPLVCSLFAYAAGAAYSWNGEPEQDDALISYFDNIVFAGGSVSIGKLIYDLGNYYKCADRDDFNATKIFKILYVQQTDCMNVTEGNYEPLFSNRDFTYMSREEYERTLEYLEEIKARLKNVTPQAKTKTYCDELDWAVNYLIHGCKLGIIKSRQFTRGDIESLYNEIANLNAQYKRIWKKQNKRTGLELSMMRMNALKRKYAAIIGKNK